MVWFWILFGLGAYFGLAGILIHASKKHQEKLLEDYRQSVRNELASQRVSADKQFDLETFMLFFATQQRRGALLVYRDPSKPFKTPPSDLKVFPLDKITGCALVQDGTMVHESAVVQGMIGAAMLGLGGAIAGSTAMHNAEHCGHLSVRVLINDLRTPSITIPFLTVTAAKSSEVYLKAFNLAQQVYNELEGIVQYNRAAQQSAPAAPAPAPAQALPGQAAAPAAAQGTVDANAQILDQIQRLAKLHSDGILTDDEFSTKKRALLDKMS